MNTHFLSLKLYSQIDIIFYQQLKQNKLIYFSQMKEQKITHRRYQQPVSRERYTVYNSRGFSYSLKADRTEACQKNNSVFPFQQIAKNHQVRRQIDVKIKKMIEKSEARQKLNQKNQKIINQTTRSFYVNRFLHRINPLEDENINQSNQDNSLLLDCFDKEKNLKVVNFLFSGTSKDKERVYDRFKKKSKDQLEKKVSIIKLKEQGSTQLNKPPIYIDFSNLERIRIEQSKNYKPEIKNSIRVYLSPLKKLQNELNQCLKQQFLNCQGIKSNTNKKQQQQKKKMIVNYLNYQKTLLIKEIQNKDLKQFSDTKQLNKFKKNNLRPFTQEKSGINEEKYAQQYSFSRKISNKKDYFVFGLGSRPLAENKIDKIELYRDFLWKINFSNSLFVLPEQDCQKHYKVFIGPGNNSMLIKSLFKRRFWWIIVDKITDDTNFIWTQLKNNDFLKVQKNYQCKIIRDDSSKSYIKSQDSFSKNSLIPNPKLLESVDIPTKISTLNIFSAEDMSLWRSHYYKFKKLEDKLDQKVYQKRSFLLKKKNAHRIQCSESLKIHNHFNQNYFIGNKKALFYTMRKYYLLNHKDPFEILPLTFHISKGLDDPEYQSFLKVYNSFNEKKIIDKSLKNIWIVKPGEFTNRGFGITVCSDLQSIKNRIKIRQRNLNGKYRTFILQKYIEKPFLYYKRKFDIRHYMMITCINGQFKGYWYEQGYIRTTSYQYNIKNCKDNLIHLTNDAIQKNTEDYGKYQKGNKISYSQFQKYLDTFYKTQKYDFFNKILPKMKDITTDAIKSSYFLLDQQKKLHNFEIFGLDFMIDQEFNPWLIQINTNPCLQLSCPLLSKIIPNMVENALKIGLDPLFQPPYNWPIAKKYQLGDNNPLESNKFSIVFDQTIEGQSIQDLYKNVDKVDKNMGQIQEQDEQYQDQGKQLQEDDA